MKYKNKEKLTNDLIILRYHSLAPDKNKSYMS